MLKVFSLTLVFSNGPSNLKHHLILRKRGKQNSSLTALLWNYPMVCHLRASSW